MDDRRKPVARRMRPVLVCVILAGMVPALADAAEKLPGDYTAIGLGGASCGTWTSRRRLEGIRRTGYEQWVLGFLSGIGYASVKDPLNDMDMDGVLAWIDNYCQAHPIAAIGEAAAAFSDAHPR